MYPSMEAPPDRKRRAVSSMDHRRNPPAESTSLHPAKKQKLVQDAAHRWSRVDFNPDVAIQKKESTDSGGSESASKWFEFHNKNVETGQRQSPHPSDEIPFYMDAHQALQTQNFASTGSEELFGHEHEEQDDSENDDLRGVIDDLTVENKRLKMLLKSSRPRPTSRSDTQDKLFDVRIHGLSVDKKRELEQLLRNFANTVNPGPSSISSSSATKGSLQAWSNDSSNQNSLHPVKNVKTLHTDSGYASNSGRTSADISGPGKPAFPISRSSRNKNIKDYLHDIPDGLMPRQSPHMTERAKMALVVRRLEQLFTGKTAAPGEHSQPLQQQEVSRSAARADAPVTDSARKEGTREAHMLPMDSKNPLDGLQPQQSSPRYQQTRLNLSAIDARQRAMDTKESNSPEQRPTRPLDLDIHRAQVAAENIDYLRHLGLSTPQMQSDVDKKDSSWIYLNLLISMAQLHTINVTPAFVRKAIQRRSTSFELSPDGHKVRWKGGSQGTSFTQEEEFAMEGTLKVKQEVNADSGHRSSKGSNTTSRSHNDMSEELSSGAKTSGIQTSSASRQQLSTDLTSALPGSLPQSKTGSTLDYQPLFYKKRYKPQESYLDSTGSSYSSNDSSGLARAMSKSALGRASSDEGMITFYNNSFFCSDASADKAPVNWKPMRTVLPWQTIGLDHNVWEESPLRHHDACYFTPQFAAKPYVPDGTESEIAFPLVELHVSGEDETQPMDMPVSGLGGVYPEDNFALDVKIGRLMHTQRSVNEQVPFTGSRKRKRYSYRTLRCDTLSLQPSRLPPPSYIFFTSSSSSGGHGSDSGSDSSSSADENYPLPANMVHQWSTESSYDETDEQDGSENDMLAMARAADPDRIAQEERAFMMTEPAMPGRVAGSLAATVGASRTSSSVGDEAGFGDEDEDDDMMGDGVASDEHANEAGSRMNVDAGDE